MVIYVIKLYRYPSGSIAKLVIEQHKNDVIDYKISSEEAIIVTKSKELAEQLNKLNNIVKVKVVEIR